LTILLWLHTSLKVERHVKLRPSRLRKSLKVMTGRLRPFGNATRNNMHVLIGTKAGVTYPKEGDKPAVKLADVAFWNEFGTETSPPRPAMRVGVENAVKNSKPLIVNYLTNLIDPKLNKANLKQLEETFMTKMAMRCEREVKKIIRDGSTATNAPATVEHKGFNKPLVETELYLDNVVAEVVQ